LAPIEWRDHKINLIDTPGYFDFFGEVCQAVRVVDAAIMAVDSVAGVEVGLEMTWKKADEYNLPRLVFFNKMDRDNASFERSLADLRARFGNHLIPFSVPIGEAEDFRGVVDLVSLH